MPFDGCFLYKTAHELNEVLSGGFVDKIHQPSADELVFVIRTKSGVKRLLISAKSGNARIGITENTPENPATPPMFCMLFRKYIGSAVLKSITQPSLERVVLLEFSATNEMGDRVIRTVAAELIGASPNIILTDDGGKIIDALHHSSIETEASRYIQPGVTYKLPDSAGKYSVLDTDINFFTKTNGLTVFDAVLSRFSGMSPKSVIYLCNAARVDTDDTATADNIKLLISRLKGALNSPYVYAVYDNRGQIEDYTFIECDGAQKYEKGPSALLDEYHTEKDKFIRTASKSKELKKLVSNLIKKNERKKELRKKELADSLDREKYRLYGELIKANIHNIKSGAAFADVKNYYDETLATVRIPLDPALSPQNNAAKYFKSYKKAFTAEEKLKSLIKECEAEAEYLDSVNDELTRADSIALLDGIREELANSGYIRAPKKHISADKGAKITTVISPSGFEVMVGKNNLQNDRITTKLADKNDLWFHTKNIAGSHVVIKTDGKTVNDDDIVFAATLAAQNSKAANSEKVPVDYTEIKYVKKPAGAKAGLVIYKTNRTVYVNPIEK